MAGAPAIRMFAAIFTTSHHGQRRAGWVLKISTKGRRFLPQLAEGQKGKVAGSAPR
jgi:hypothetical protein